MASAQELFNELSHVPTEVRLNGNRWRWWLNELAERYGLEPDSRSRLEIVMADKEWWQR